MCASGNPRNLQKYSFRITAAWLTVHQSRYIQWRWNRSKYCRFVPTIDEPKSLEFTSKCRSRFRIPINTKCMINCLEACWLNAWKNLRLVPFCLHRMLRDSGNKFVNKISGRLCLQEFLEIFSKSHPFVNYFHAMHVRSQKSEIGGKD